MEEVTTNEELGCLMRLAKGQTVLELGSWHGRSTLALSSTAKVVHAVDWFRGDPHAGEGDTLRSYLDSTRDVGNIVTHIGRFEDVLPVLGKNFGLIFLDAFHTYESVCKDIGLALPHLRKGGIMVFHDYGLEQFGVTQAVDEKFSEVEVFCSLAIVRNR